MLIYLTNNEHKDHFDFLREEKGMIIKKYVGEYSLRKFVINDLKNMSSCNYLVVDLACLNDTEENFFEAVEMVQNFFLARLILFSEDFNSEEKYVLEKLMEHEVYNLVTGENVEELQRRIENCFSLEGMTFNDHKKPMTKEEVTYHEEAVEAIMIDVEKIEKKEKRLNKKIVIAGIESASQTTEVAFQLGNYLSSEGFLTAYMSVKNIDGQKELTSLNSSHNYQEKDFDYYSRNDSFEKDYDYLIFDIGEIASEKSLTVLAQGEIKMICAGGRVHEIKRNNEVTKGLKSKGIEQTYLALHDVPEDVQGMVANQLEQSEFIFLNKKDNNKNFEFILNA